jgi:hypothetical protein
MFTRLPFFIVLLSVPLSAVWAEDVPEKYLLRYRFLKSEVLKWEVTHLLKVQTQIQGTREDIETASRSIKIWTVKDVDKEGIAVIEHLVERAKMQKRQTGLPDISYNSDKDTTPSDDFMSVAGNIGVPLARISFDPMGNVKKRLQLVPYADSVFEDKVLMTFPEEPVAVGETWKSNFDIPLPQPGGTVRMIRARQIFTLKEVKTGIATIEFRTEILTPTASEPKIEDQLLGRMVQGTLRLDLDDGRLLSRQSEVIQSVIGFEGTSSNKQYRLRLTEELQ